MQLFTESLACKAGVFCHRCSNPADPFTALMAKGYELPGGRLDFTCPKGIDRTVIPPEPSRPEPPPLLIWPKDEPPLDPLDTNDPRNFTQGCGPCGRTK